MTSGAPRQVQDDAAVANTGLMTSWLVLLFAVAGGAAVGSLYYAQPLLAVIGQDLHIGASSVGLLVTATQLGYVLGILFIVPLGDTRDPSRLVPVMMALAALALAACAVAPGFIALACALAAVGITTVSGQLLAPLAGDLADDASRGRVVGIVVSGLVTGILVARIASGLLAEFGGWRTVFLVAAVVDLVLAGSLRRFVPRRPVRNPTPYRVLLRSVFSLVARERALRLTMLFGAIGFAGFTVFWTALTLLLSDPPYHFPTSVIGLFGLAGLVGALAAQGAGRLHDRGHSVPATGLGWVLVLLAWVLAGVGAHLLVLLVLGIVVLDIGVQGQNILNQSRVFHLYPGSRSRVNTAYITGNFTGGAIGSLLATVLWTAGGWHAVSLAGAGLAVLALALWLATRRGALRTAT